MILHSFNFEVVCRFSAMRKKTKKPFASVLETHYENKEILSNPVFERSTIRYFCIKRTILVGNR